MNTQAKPMNSLDYLRAHSILVADTGDFSALEAYAASDSTTNPSLLLKTLVNPAYQFLVEPVLAELKKTNEPIETKVDKAVDRLSVAVGCEILKRIPGFISTEVDARLAFEVEKSVEKARTLIKLYESKGVSRERILIKLAATYEGIQTAKVLKAENINCNMTLLFNFYQAVACMQAGVFMISPFVGRVLDWYKAKHKTEFHPHDDPGVLLVQRIYQYYKQQGSPTIVMAASFRNIGEIKALAGCDRLTISPALLDELKKSTEPVDKALDKLHTPIHVVPLMREADFRWQLNEDPMATEKLADGIRIFAADTMKLEDFIRKFM